MDGPPRSITLLKEEDPMLRVDRRARTMLVAIAALVAAATARPACAASGSQIASASRAALNRLYAQQKAAKTLGQKAVAILVFPDIVKAGFMFGGQMGDGALLKGGKVAGYYNTVAVSYGFQAGIQSFGYALFFMNNAALAQLDKTGGFELGVGPSFVIVDEGKGKSITSNTITSDVYAFIFSQKGLMAGMGIQGSKITRISK
jgi:lipid-binding SYLF domain-containing protein